MKSFLVLAVLFFFTSCEGKKPPQHIAIVKVKDTIYHCEDVRVDQCGLFVRCGTITMACLKDVTIEWL